MDDLCNDIFKNQNKQKKNASNQGDKRIGYCQILQV